MAEPASSDPPSVSTDELVAELRRTVDQRRRSGAYPDDLEQRLEAQFQRIVERGPRPYDFGELTALLDAVDEKLAFSPDAIDYSSGVPGGTRLHRIVALAVARQTAGILEQVSEFATTVRDALREVAAVLEHPEGHSHDNVVAMVDAILERLSTYERANALGPNLGAELLRRIEALEHAAERPGAPGG